MWMMRTNGNDDDGEQSENPMVVPLPALATVIFHADRPALSRHEPMTNDIIFHFYETNDNDVISRHD